jgi:hypothetical protein
MRLNLQFGCTNDHLRQAEEELEIPTSASPKVHTKLMESSIAKMVIEVWVNNR